VSLHAIFFILYYVVSCVVALVSPIVGVVCYLVVYHVYPETTWWGHELAPLHIRYSLFIAVATGIGFVAHAHKHPTLRPYISLFEVLCFLMLANIWLTPLIGAGWLRWTAMKLDKMTKIFIFLFLLAHIVVRMRYYQWLVLAWVISALYVGHAAHTAPRGSFYLGRLDGIGGPDFREATALSLHLAATLPLIGVQFLRPGLWPKVLSFFAAAFACQGIILAQGRSAMVGLVAGVVTAVCRSPKGRRARIGLAITLGLIGGYSLTDDAFWQRMRTILAPSEQRDPSAQGRIHIWRTALHMWEDYPLGIGIGTFEPIIGKYSRSLDGSDSHSSYIDALVELGVQGFVLLSALIFCSFRELTRCRRLARGTVLQRDIDLQVYALRISLVVFLFASLTLTRLYAEAFWWLLAMPLCLRRSLQNELARLDRPPSRCGSGMDEVDWETADDPDLVWPESGGSAVVDEPAEAKR